jgi:catechol 2,3-dioxygenase-like lactoylglutathione lyase family enzyme
MSLARCQSLAVLGILLGAPVAGDDEQVPVVTYAPSLLVQLQVSDLDRSLRFYTETLGFKLTERRDDLEFAHLDCGVPGLQLGLSAGGSLPPNPGSVVLNFGVRGDVEVSRKALEVKGVAFRGATVVIPGKVRLAEFSDPDGYRIRLTGEDGGAAR